MNIEKILEDILSGTDFEVYGITENNVELEITLTGDNLNDLDTQEIVKLNIFS